MNNKLRLSVRIAFGFSVLIAIVLVMGIYTVRELRGIERWSVDVSDQAVPLLIKSMNIERLPERKRKAKPKPEKKSAA